MSEIGPFAIPFISSCVKKPALTASAPAWRPNELYQGFPFIVLIKIVKFVAYEEYNVPRAAFPDFVKKSPAHAKARIASNRYKFCVSGVVLFANPEPVRSSLEGFKKVGLI